MLFSKCCLPGPQCFDHEREAPVVRRGHSTGQNPPTPFCFSVLIFWVHQGDFWLNNLASFPKHTDIGKGVTWIGSMRILSSRKGISECLHYTLVNLYTDLSIDSINLVKIRSSLKKICFVGLSINLWNLLPLGTWESRSCDQPPMGSSRCLPRFQHSRHPFPQGWHHQTLCWLVRLWVLKRFYVFLLFTTLWWQ